MSNKKQTALDWFFDEILKYGYIKKLPIVEFQQAKAMEKQQIIDALRDGYSFLGDSYDNEQYYNETFYNTTDNETI
jgi:hypothetical protein